MECTTEKLPATFKELDFTLISQAYDEFKQKRYVNCIQSLDQLEQSIGGSPQISYNKKIVEFYQSNCKEYNQLLHYIDQEFFDGRKKVGNVSAVCYTKAVLFFHLRKPLAAIKVLQPLINNLKEVEEYIIARVGLLYATLLLVTNQNKKALKFLEELKGYLNIDIESLLSEENFSNLEACNDSNEYKRHFKILIILAKLLNNINVVFVEDEGFEFAMLKARFLYMGKDFQMAAKQLTKTHKSDKMRTTNNGEDEDTYLANNMGIIHLRVRHYAIAAKFFQQAIIFDNKTIMNKAERSLHSIGALKKPEILYNLGIAMLHLRRPKEAFECFVIPLKIYHYNPRLWLRTAEACIMLYEMDKESSRKSHIVTSVIGTGSHRKYLIEPTKQLHCTKDEQLFAIPNPTLEFAALCLRNAASLIEKIRRKRFNNNKDHEISDEENLFPISKDSFEELIAAIFATYSYVSLRLGDFLIGLEYSKKLLALENLSDTNAFLGHLYCAESLIMLNRINEARTLLDPKFIANLNAQEFETKGWIINSLDAAQSVLRYNLVVVLVLLGELELAKTLLPSCTHSVTFNQFKRLKMYIELAASNIENCKIMVRIDTPQFR